MVAMSEHTMSKMLRWLTLLVMVMPVLLALLAPEFAHAQTNMPDGTCSNDPQFDIDVGYGNSGDRKSVV